MQAMEITSDIKRLNANIVHMILSGDVCAKDCELFLFVDDAGQSYRQGVISLIEDEDISIIFTLPQEQKSNIYLLATDGPIPLVRKLLANIEESESDSSIFTGNVLLMDGLELQERDIFGVIFLPVDVSNALDFLPSKFTFEHNDFEFILVVTISQKEHAIWKTQGHDALMDYVELNGKDLISFGAD
jgi:hypothetical protein